MIFLTEIKIKVPKKQEQKEKSFKNINKMSSKKKTKNLKLNSK